MKNQTRVAFTIVSRFFIHYLRATFLIQNEQPFDTSKVQKIAQNQYDTRVEVGYLLVRSGLMFWSSISILV